MKQQAKYGSYWFDKISLIISKFMRNHKNKSIVDQVKCNKFLKNDVS